MIEAKYFFANLYGKPIFKVERRILDNFVFISYDVIFVQFAFETIVSKSEIFRKDNFHF